LKVTRCGQIHRILMGHEGSGPTFDGVVEAVRRLWPDAATESIMTFHSCGGEPLALNEESFLSFVAAGVRSPGGVAGGRLTLRLELLDRASPAATPTQAVAASSLHGRSRRLRLRAKPEQKKWREDDRDLEELVRELEDGCEVEVLANSEKRKRQRRQRAKKKGMAEKRKCIDEIAEKFSDHENYSADLDAESAADKQQVIALEASDADEQDVEDAGDWSNHILAEDDASACPSPSASQSGWSSPQCWPATPCSTPPSSPRAASESGDQAAAKVVWVPVPVWVPVLPMVTC